MKRYEDKIGDSKVYNLYNDLKGNMWVCTLNNGLFNIKLYDKSINNYKNSEEEFSIPSNNVKDIVFDSKGKLWVSTNKGISNFDYEKEIFINYKKEPYENNTLISDETFCFLKDTSGFIWTGTYSGISIFNPNANFTHFKVNVGDENSLSGNMIHGIYEDDNKTLWVGTDNNGVNIVNGDYIKHLNTENSNIISDKIKDITGFDKYVFVGTDEGLSVVIKNGDKNYNIINYTDKDGLPSNKIRSLYVDSKDYLWIGTNKGLAVLNIKKEKIIDVTYILDNVGVSDKFIRAIYEDSNGNYYIGCFLDGGLIKINSTTKEYTVYTNNDDYYSISNNSIRYITEDLEGNILVGTSYGLNILNSNKDTFYHYTENEGLTNSNIYGILVDENNDIWISTNGGISKVSLKENTVENFTISDGLQSNEFNGRSCFKSKDGRMYFGGINGFNIINLDDIEEHSFKPQVVFDKFEINGVIKKDINDMKFSFDENNIKISFFSNDYKNQKKTRYYYKLSGLEDEWNVTISNSIVFANLPPGEYTLDIKAMTQRGIESENASVSFIIKTPFWKSKYAIFLYCVLIVIFIYLHINKVKRLDKLVNKKNL